MAASALYKELSDKVERSHLFSGEQCDTLCRHKGVEVFIHAEKKQSGECFIGRQGIAS